LQLQTAMNELMIASSPIKNKLYTDEKGRKSYYTHRS